MDPLLLFLLLYDPLFYPFKGRIRCVLYGFVIEIRQNWDDSETSGGWSPRPHARILRDGKRFLRLVHSSMDGKCWKGPVEAS